VNAGSRADSSAAVTNVVLKLLSSPVEKVCRLAAFVVAAKALGPAAFGVLQFALTVVTVLALGTDLGLGIWTTRALAARRAQAGAIVGTSLLLRLGTFGPYLALVATAALTRADGSERAVLAILGGATVASTFADYVAAVLRGLEDFRRESALNVGRAMAASAGALIALTLAHTATSFALGWTAGSFAGAGLAGLLLLQRQPGAFARVRAAGRTSAPLLRAAELVPLWLVSVFSVLYFRCDVVLLRVLANDTQVGLYAAAYRVFEAWTLVPSAVIAVAFPRFARLHASDAKGGLEVRSTLLLASLGAAAAALSVAGEHRLIPALFGRDFAAAGAAFHVLALALPLLFSNFALSTYLLASGRERAYLALSALLLVFNVGLNVVVIPRQGNVGAAWVTLATEAVRTAGCAALLALARGRASVSPSST
jgi:O-antigen/teichoic acid export membrane protein